MTTPKRSGITANMRTKMENEEKQSASLLFSQSGVNSLLNSQPGKMTLKQLQTAVVAHQHAEKEQEEEVHRMTSGIEEANQSGASGSGSGSGGHTFDHTRQADVDDTFPGDNTQMKEMIFQRAITLYQQHERSLQINPTKHRIGHTLMTEQQRFDLEYNRELRKAQSKASARDAARRQSSNITTDARVISMVGENSLRQPTFIVDEAAAWNARKRMLSRFLSSVNKFVVRRRVAGRLASIQSQTQPNARKKLNAAEVSLNSAHPLSLASIHDEAAHLMRDFQLQTNNVQGVGHERGHDKPQRTEVQLEPITQTKELVTFDEIIPHDACVINYPSLATGAIPTYVGSGWLSGLRSGAWEESLLRGPRGGASFDPPLVSATVVMSSAGVVAAAGTGELTSPMRGSTALLDSNMQQVKTNKPSATKTPKAKAKGDNSNKQQQGQAQGGAQNDKRALDMPPQLLAPHPLAQQPVASVSSSSWSAAFPAAALATKMKLTSGTLDGALATQPTVDGAPDSSTLPPLVATGATGAADHHSHVAPHAPGVSLALTLPHVDGDGVAIMRPSRAHTSIRPVDAHNGKGKNRSKNNTNALTNDALTTPNDRDHQPHHTNHNEINPTDDAHTTAHTNNDQHTQPDNNEPTTEAKRPNDKAPTVTGTPKHASRTKK